MKHGHEQPPEQSSYPCSRVGSDPVSVVHRIHECYHLSFCRVALFFVPRRIGAIHCFEAQDSEVAVGHLFWLHRRLLTATQDPAASTGSSPTALWSAPRTGDRGSARNPSTTKCQVPVDNWLAHVRPETPSRLLMSKPPEGTAPWP